MTRRLLAAGTEYTDLPGRHVTPNQIVAYNMAYWRRAAGLTQEELADRLSGWTPKKWSKAAVSAAERSWDGKRTRQFDADLLFGLATAFDLPITAFFLPPADDGVERRYLIDPTYPFKFGENYGGCQNMYDLLGRVLSQPAYSQDPDEVPVDYFHERRYRERLFATIDFYFGEGAAEEWAPRELGSEEMLVSRLEQVRQQYNALQSVMGDLSKMHEALSNRLVDLRRPAYVEERERERAAMAESIKKARLREGEMIEAAIRLYQDGMPIEEIASTVKTGGIHVIRILNEAGLISDEEASGLPEDLAEKVREIMARLRKEREAPGEESTGGDSE